MPWRQNGSEHRVSHSFQTKGESGDNQSHSITHCGYLLVGGACQIPKPPRQRIIRDNPATDLVGYQEQRVTDSL